MNAVNKPLKSINCTECSAPLNLLGGRQVKSISCSYCGAVLKNKDEYKVVEHFLQVDRPKSPLKIGQQAVLNKVEFTLIGLIKYQTTRYWNFSSHRWMSNSASNTTHWIDYQLFSPTHGYAWLTYEAGHFLFGRKVHYPINAYSKKIKSEFKVNGQKYKVIDYYQAKIVFVEGELTWVAHKNDQIKLLDAVAPPYLYSIEETSHEEEYHLSQYLSVESVYKSFNLQKTPPKTTRIHPAQPYKPSHFLNELTMTSKFFVKIYLIILLLMTIFGSGSEMLLKTAISVQQYNNGYRSKPFIIEDASDLFTINLVANLSNDWAFFHINLYKDAQVVHSVAKELYFYRKYSTIEGIEKAQLYFKVPTAGTYTVSVQGKGEKNTRALRLNIQKEAMSKGYFWKLLIGSILCAWLIPCLDRYRFKKKRQNDNE